MSDRSSGWYARRRLRTVTSAHSGPRNPTGSFAEYPNAGSAVYPCSRSASTPRGRCFFQEDRDTYIRDILATIGIPVV